MHDIIDRLARLSDEPSDSVSAETVQADLARGRRALTRRRLLGATGAAAVVAASGGYLAVTTQPAQPSAHSQTVVDQQVQLVAYTGKQSEAFHIAKIPAGFSLSLHTSNRYLLVLAPKEYNTPDPAGVTDFKGRLGVYLQREPYVMAGRPVTVNGQPGALDKDQDGVRMLYFRSGSHVVIVQCWSNIKLTDAQLISFAEGITVTPAARESD